MKQNITFTKKVELKIVDKQVKKFYGE